MKVVFMGTPEIAVPTLEKLVENKIEVPLVLCQPDKPKGRGKKVLPPPVKETALKHNIEVYQPSSLKNNEEAFNKINAIQPDFLVVVAYGKILPLEILNIPKKAPINVHFSLLPKYRGAAPVNWAIINGEEKTGVTTMIMAEGLDTGDMLLKLETEIGKKTTIDLAEELSHSGADLLIKTLNEFDNITPEKQNDEESSYAPLMKKTDGLIDWTKSADEIERRIRGFNPWPTAFTYLQDKTLKIYKAEVVENKKQVDCGQIFGISKKSFLVKCGENALKILELQLEGKKKMETHSFLSGFDLKDGEILGERT
jgi:methionyl-tRNA formyltransferase